MTHHRVGFTFTPEGARVEIVMPCDTPAIPAIPAVQECDGRTRLRDPWRTWRLRGSLRREEPFFEPLNDLAPVIALWEGEADPAGSAVILAGPETDTVLSGKPLAPLGRIRLL